MVDIGLRVLTRPDPLALPEIYRRLGMDYDDKVLPSIVTEVVKQIIAQFNATALLTQREQVSRKIKQLLEERAKEFHIILEVCACLRACRWVVDAVWMPYAPHHVHVRDAVRALPCRTCPSRT